MYRKVLLLAACLGPVRAPRKASGDDGTALAHDRCKRKHHNLSARRECVQSYLRRKSDVSTASSFSASAAGACPIPADGATKAEILRVDQCLHRPEVGTNTELLYKHILQPAAQCSALPAADRQRCLLHAGDANNFAGTH